MAKAKKTTNKVTPKVEPKVVKEEPKKEVASYMVALFFQREPIEKDIHVADIRYHKSSNGFSLFCTAPQHEAEIEMIVEGDISVSGDKGAIEMISKAESPISWISNLHRSREFAGNPFIAKVAEESDEA
jgi:hypothetical protein